jgi:hypothetical protein
MIELAYVDQYGEIDHILTLLVDRDLVIEK